MMERLLREVLTQIVNALLVIEIRVLQRVGIGKLDCYVNFTVLCKRGEKGLERHFVAIQDLRRFLVDGTLQVGVPHPFNG